MWLLPTRRRLIQLQAFFDQAIATGISTPGVILVEMSEFDELIDEYNALRLPNGWSVASVNAEGMAAKVREAYAGGICGPFLRSSAATQWVGVLTDDQFPIVGFLVSHDHPEQGRLPGSVGADDPDDAARRQEK